MSFKDIFVFDRMVAPTLIKILYWLGLAGVVLAGIGIMFSGGLMGGGHGMGQQATGLTFASFLMGLVYIVFAGLFWRVLCELLIVVFEIHARLREIRDGNLKSSSKAAVTD